MALKQQAKGSFDNLTQLTEQQLRSILSEEMDSEDVDYELIKNITDVLASKTNDVPFDPEKAYKLFMSEYADTDLLYDDLMDELVDHSDENSNGNADDSTTANPRKIVHFSRLAKFAILVAAILALFFAVTVVASAMGFNIWRANVGWDQDNMGVSSVAGKTIMSDADPYYQIREALSAEGIDWPIIPYYLPVGFSLLDFQVFDTPQGMVYVLAFSNGEDMFALRYALYPLELNEFFPKDDAEIELYITNGIEHFISCNEGFYRAVWANDDIVCEIQGMKEKEELLKLIDSVYKE